MKSSTRSISLAAAAALALAACNQNRAEENVTGTDLNATDNNAGNAAMATATATPAEAAFVTEAMKGDNSEVALGNLAQQQGTSQGVKDLGMMLATDHGSHKESLTALATQVGVPVTAELKEDAKAEETRLNGLSGADFDREFVRATIEDHQKDIAAYEQAAKGTGPVAEMAKTTLPTLEKHLETAQKLPH